MGVQCLSMRGAFEWKEGMWLRERSSAKMLDLVSMYNGYRVNLRDASMNARPLMRCISPRFSSVGTLLLLGYRNSN